MFILKNLVKKQIHLINPKCSTLPHPYLPKKNHPSLDFSLNATPSWTSWWSRQTIPTIFLFRSFSKCLLHLLFLSCLFLLCTCFLRCNRKYDVFCCYNLFLYQYHLFTHNCKLFFWMINSLCQIYRLVMSNVNINLIFILF